MTSDVLELDYLDFVFDCHEIDKLVAYRRQQPGCDYTYERIASPEEPDRLSERRCRQAEAGWQSDRDRTVFLSVVELHLRIFFITNPLVSGFPNRSWTK